MKPCCLTIAGSDSGGNAGVQADLRAFHCYGLHGCTVFAALTAQNPSGVSAVRVLEPDFIAAQLDAVLGVYNIRALKTGMLAVPEAIRTVASRLRAYPDIAKVIDPVMVATSGSKLLRDDAVKALADELIPLATILTPNLPEADVLLGDGAAALTAEEKACALHARFGCAVLVKGGHGDGAEAVDVLCDAAGRVKLFSAPRLVAPVSTHGTGCSLAAALASALALGLPLDEAVASAKRYVREAIARAEYVGEGCGVLGFVPDARETCEAAGYA